MGRWLSAPTPAAAAAGAVVPVSVVAVCGRAGSTGRRAHRSAVWELPAGEGVRTEG